MAWDAGVRISVGEVCDERWYFGTQCADLSYDRRLAISQVHKIDQDASDATRTQPGSEPYHSRRIAGHAHRQEDPVASRVVGLASQTVALVTPVRITTHGGEEGGGVSPLMTGSRNGILRRLRLSWLENA